MNVKVRKAGDVVIVDLDGRLVAGIGDELLRDVVNELLAEGWKKILVNLSTVTAVDSAGVGELVSSLKTSRHLGASLKIFSLHDRVRKPLHMSQILPLFEVYEDEKAAVGSFLLAGDAPGPH
jgi:anti-sigma B factor antagonist